MSQKKFSTAVLVLSVICAFLLGIIGGYLLSPMTFFWRANNIPSMPINSTVYDSPIERESIARKDIVFYNPGNDALWNESYKQIPDGDGEITGKVFIDDKPAYGLEFSLILANGQKTTKTVVKRDGSYEIKLPVGKFFFNGILVYNKSQDINDKFLINKISNSEGLSMLLENNNAMSVQDEYAKLEKDIGAEKAAERILKSVVSSTPFRDKFPFEVGETPFVFPAIHYRDPIGILSPLNSTKIPLNKLVFIWEPVHGAAYYKATVTNIKKDGTTTSYHPVAASTNIDGNQISYADLIARLKEVQSDNGCDRNVELEENKLYGFRVIAYSQNNTIITASSDSSTELSIFSVSR